MIGDRLLTAPVTFAVTAGAWAMTGSWIAPVSAAVTLVAVSALMGRANLRAPRELTSGGDCDTHRIPAGSDVGRQTFGLLCLGVGSCSILARLQLDGVDSAVTAFATGSVIGVCLCVLLDALPRPLGLSAPAPGERAVLAVAVIAPAATATALAATRIGAWKPATSALGLTLVLGVHAISRPTGRTASPERGLSR